MHYTISEESMKALVALREGAMDDEHFLELLLELMGE